MQEALQQHVQPQDPLAAAFRPEALRVRPLPSQVYAVCSSQAAQAVAHQRAALHVRRMPEEVHQRQWSAHSLEDDQLQAEQSRGGDGTREVSH